MKFKSIVVMTGILLGTVPVYGFTDVDKNHWCYNTITSMQQERQLSIITQGEFFYPDEPITRGEFVAFLMQVCMPEQTGILHTQDQEQVKENLRPYLGAAQEQGVFFGSKDMDGMVWANAAEKVTRQDAAVIVGRFLKVTSQKETSFTDNLLIAPYARNIISALQEENLISGMEDGSFQPLEPITRAEAVQMIQQVKNSQKEKVVSSEETVVSTFAGTGAEGYFNGKRENAVFFQPTGIVGNGSGTLYILDTNNNLIRKIQKDTVSDVAGQIPGRDMYGVAIGYFQDGDVTKAMFASPEYGAVNQKGELFVSDEQNHCIRQITEKKVYTFCGDGTQGYRNGAPQSSRFHAPGAIAIDKENNLFIADTLNHCIRKVTPEGKSSLFAGRPSMGGYQDGAAEQARFLEPVGIAVDKDGTVYVADTGNQRIRKIKDGQVTTIAGSATRNYLDTEYKEIGSQDGTAMEATFAFPKGIALTEDGGLFIADSVNHVIRFLSKDGKVTTVAGNGEPGYRDGKASEAMFNLPTDVYYENGKIYIADSLNHVIRCMDWIKKGE